MRRYGNEYGGYVLPEGMINGNSVVYSFGLGEDASFDIDVMASHSCPVHIFDPTPRAEIYYNIHLSTFTNFIFHHYGLWLEDTEKRFYFPANRSHVSCSIVNLQNTKEYFIGQVKRLQTIMRELNNERIDVLKVDIEGAESEVIPDMIRSGIRPGIICIELHKGCENIAAMIEGFGYSVFHKGHTLTFIHEDSNLPDSL